MVVGLAEKVPVAVAAVGLGVNTRVPSVAVPLVRTLLVKVPLPDAVVGALAVTVTEIPFVTVTDSPPPRLLDEKVPVSLAVVDAPLYSWFMATMLGWASTPPASVVPPQEKFAAVIVVVVPMLFPAVPAVLAVTVTTAPLDVGVTAETFR